MNEFMNNLYNAIGAEVTGYHYDAPFQGAITYTRVKYGNDISVHVDDGENIYVIEMAVAGFSKSQIEIEIDGDKLNIRGNTDEAEAEDHYLYRGLAARPFTRTFMLNDNVEVKNAAFVNGMLKVFLEHITPEQNKPKRIEISDEPETISQYAGGNMFKSGEQIFGPED